MTPEQTMVAIRASALLEADRFAGGHFDSSLVHCSEVNVSKNQVLLKDRDGNTMTLGYAATPEYLAAWREGCTYAGFIQAPSAAAMLDLLGIC